MDEVVRLVSYDGTIAAQCLRMAALSVVRPVAASQIDQGSSDQSGPAAGADNSSYLLPGPGVPHEKMGA